MFDLGDETEHSGRISGLAMQTVVSNAGLLFSPEMLRWIMIPEIAASLGHPITDDQVEAAGGLVSPFSLKTEPPSTRTRSSSMYALGNTMHINAVGAVLCTICLVFPNLGRNDTMVADSSISRFSKARRKVLARQAYSSPSAPGNKKRKHMGMNGMHVGRQ